MVDWCLILCWIFFFACVNECQNIVLLIHKTICIKLYYWSSYDSQSQNKAVKLLVGKSHWQWKLRNHLMYLIFFCQKKLNRFFCKVHNQLFTFQVVKLKVMCVTWKVISMKTYREDANKFSFFHFSFWDHEH